MVRIARHAGGIGASRNFVSHGLRGVWALVLICGAWGSRACADHLFQSDIFPDYRAAEWAKMSMDYADLIAVGEFVSVCDPGFGKSPLRDRRLVTAKFKIEELFKDTSGSSEVGTIVDIQVEGDMLIYPGERITRYQKRKELRQEINDRKHAIRKRLEDIENGRDPVESAGVSYDEQELRTELAELVDRSLNTPPSMLAVFHQPSFYEVGGMIEPNVKYVVALWLEDDGSFLLAESYDRDIFWGEEAQQMAEAFRSLTGLESSFDAVSSLSLAGLGCPR